MGFDCHRYEQKVSALKRDNKCAADTKILRVDSHRTDLRSIMAEAESLSPKFGPSTPTSAGAPGKGKYIHPSARRVSTPGMSISPSQSPVPTGNTSSAPVPIGTSNRLEKPTGSWRPSVGSKASPSGSLTSSEFPTLGSAPAPKVSGGGGPSQSSSIAGSSRPSVASTKARSDVIVPVKQSNLSRPTPKSKSS